MRLTDWQKILFAVLLLILVGQSAMASRVICPMHTQSLAQTDTPPCHQHPQAAPTAPHKADCCQQLGHCLAQGAVALISAELNFSPNSSRAAADYGYNRTPPVPQDYPLFRPPIVS